MDTRQILAAGVGVQNGFVRDDYWGVALSWSQPNDSLLRDQWAGELSYRFQISPHQQLTVGVQGIADPSEDPDEDFVGVVQVRWGLTF